LTKYSFGYILIIGEVINSLSPDSCNYILIACDPGLMAKHMPNQDGTGPLGKGAGTGRGLGPCGNGSKNGRPARGRGIGRRLGLGRQAQNDEDKKDQ